jgi:2-haloacid dehalogenase/putative hydrolase of the HAD superfamily
MPRYDVITFDCYGTLIDWESGIANAFIGTAATDGVTLTREAVLRAYADTEHRVQEAGYRPYRDILRDTAVRVAAIVGWPLMAERAGFLAESLPSWQPFADTNAALERLAAVSRLGILSNIDDDLLAATREHFTVRFDVVVTAQQVRSYKPGHAHFRTARDLIGRRRGCTRRRATSTTSFRPTSSASTTPGSIASGRTNCQAGRRSTHSTTWQDSLARWRKTSRPQLHASSFRQRIGESAVRFINPGKR